MPPERKLFWLLVAATAVLYGAMLFGTGPVIMREAGGLWPFDVRMTGYSLDDARAFLTALSASGKSVYLGPAMWMDTVFPGAFALVLGLSLWGLSAGRRVAFRLAAVFAAALYGMFDYMENAAVATLLNTAPDALDAAIVARASRWTVLKFAFVDVAILLLAGLLIARRRARRNRRSGA